MPASPLISKRVRILNRIRGDPHLHLGINGYHGWKNGTLASHTVFLDDQLHSVSNTRNDDCSRDVDLLCGELDVVVAGHRARLQKLDGEELRNESVCQWLASCGDAETIGSPHKLLWKASPDRRTARDPTATTFRLPRQRLSTLAIRL